MAKHSAITPEYLYYFEPDKGPEHFDAPANQTPSQGFLESAWSRISRTLFPGLAKICLLLVTFSAPLAAPFVENPAKFDRKPVEIAVQPRGADVLKAQMSALQGGLSDLRRLRHFLNDDLGAARVLSRAQKLIETMPAHEKAGEAAWRIAAVTSLTLESGGLSDIDVDNGYRLGRGSVGWDFGPEGADVHVGFTPVTPASFEGDLRGSAITGATALTDGIAALGSFRGSLPNGLYRVLIVRDGDNAGKAPFGDTVTLNGAPVKSRDSTVRERRRLVGAATPDSQPTSGIGVQGWAIVENGELHIDFSAMPDGGTISAVIAEPFEIDKVDLQPVVIEALAEALGGMTPAAGPAPRNSRGVLRNARGVQANGATRPNAGNTPTPRQKPVRTQPKAPSGAGARFATSRGSASGGPVAPVSQAPSATPATVPGDATSGTAFDVSDAPPVETRETLVKRSAGKGADSEGLAIDLGAVLDDASPSGTFICLTDPCEDLLPIAPEPDLAAAAALLGDWLEGTDNLPAAWTALETVLEGRDSGDEVAVVYEFGVDSAGWTDVELLISAGSGVFVWLNGSYVFGASEAGDFVDDLDFEYRIALPDLSNGIHFLQILGESRSGTPGYALELRGTPVNSVKLATTTVDEPGTLFLMGIGMLVFAFVARHRL